MGLSGAAAQNAGLAMLGFGSLASGELGMAGGSMVVAAAGGLLGSAFGVVGQVLFSGVSVLSESGAFGGLVVGGFSAHSLASWSVEL